MLTSTLQMAWRNIWRNTRRTLITGSAIGLGLAAMILYLGMQEGMNRRMRHTATRSYLGDAQVHAVGYRDTRELELTIPRGAERLADARKLPAALAASPRLLATGLLAIGDRSAGVELIGIDPECEPGVTDWSERLLAGHYPREGDHALLGRDLADKLELTAGGKFVLTVAEEETGELRSLLLRVAGVYFTGNPALDKYAAILPITTLREAVAMPGAMHEIALRLDLHSGEEEDLRAALAPLAAEDLDVAPWQELAPALASMLDLQDFYFGLTVLIVFSIIALGIVNTLTMSLVERTWEFGILRAVGTSPWRLAGLIFAEAASLGLVGSAIGLALGLLVHWPLSTHGFNLGGFQVAGVNFESRLHTVLEPLPLILLCLIFIALTTVVALSTAVRAARIRPADALREF